MDAFFPALVVIVTSAAVGAVWLLRNRLAQGARSLGSDYVAVTVVARRSLGGEASVAVVETEGRRFLLGVTRQAITVLDRVDLDLDVAETTAIAVPANPVADATGSPLDDDPASDAKGRADSVAHERAARRLVADTVAADRALAAISTLEQVASHAAPVSTEAMLPAPPALHSFEIHSGGVPRLHPTPVVSFEQALSDARAVGARQEASDELSDAERRRPVTAPIPLLPATRRARRQAEAEEASAAKRRASAAGRKVQA